MVSGAKQGRHTTDGASVPSGDMAGAINLFANPMAGMMAFSAIGAGVASQAMGFWMGTVAGVADASRQMFAPVAEASAKDTAKRTASNKARSATKVLMEDVQSAALEIAGAATGMITAEVRPDLQQDAFRQPVSVSRPAQPDDLKVVSGVGPKLEKVLNDLGVWTYAQIAAWTDKEVGWIDDYLSLKGRIERDDWIGQASSLSKKAKR